MRKIFTAIFILFSYTMSAQNGSGKDSTAFLDSIMKEMDDILDHMMPHKSYFSVSAGVGTGFFNFKSSAAIQPQSEKKLLLSPDIRYIHKSGFGISATGYALFEGSGLNPYQVSLSPSYDYKKRGKWSGAIAFSRYFTKAHLSFYTTPLQNETYAYFNYKKSWLQPGISVGYGWGSHAEYEERKVSLLKLRRKRNPALITMRKEESIQDFSVLISVRHDFDLPKIISAHDLLTITPVLMLSSGTRNFGFNTSYQGRAKVISNFLPENQNIQDRSSFQPQSTSLLMRADYSVGIFFFQSQFLLDYSLRDSDKQINNAFALLTGVNF